ncbi:hypothetical protein [Stakelama pacifica]|uniref:Uncharacterized protein n=1 Tax=Stakelama pacifica TaxID=517720 RepID=A0A4R6FH00_9SPHN|nr:hypothetical protein [Stakelama pacifica]TDN80649.1 hypothetical protein EV664_10939 [Stakelama pacifica]
MKRALTALVCGTVLSGMAAAYAASLHKTGTQAIIPSAMAASSEIAQR